MPRPLFRLRPYARETEYERGLRMQIKKWRRQGGKTTSLGVRSLRRMAARRDHRITFVSASLLVGGEIVETNAKLFRDLLRNHAQGMPITTNVRDGTDDDFAEIFEKGRLKVKLWHDRTSFSRLQVIAPNPATARGWTGDVFFDEFAWVPDFQDMWDAVEPIFSSDPDFTCLLATTPPKDDSHFSHELMLPSQETLEALEEVKAEGHWYRSEAGIMVHHVDAWDAEAAGAKLYHYESGEVLTPDQHRALAVDKESWDRNYAMILATSGMAALSRVSLALAQNHPEARRCTTINDKAELPANWTDHLTPDAPWALGFDIATTDKEKSNPSVLSAAQMVNGHFVPRLIWRWKTSDPEVAKNRIKLVIKSGSAVMKRGPRMMSVDASNERYFAAILKAALRLLVKIILIIANEVIRHHGQNMSYKQYQGNELVNVYDEGKASLPPDKWVFDDMRLVKRDNGSFSNATDAEGNHGDVFDSLKQCHFALTNKGVPTRPRPFSPPEGSRRSEARRRTAA